MSSRPPWGRDVSLGILLLLVLGALFPSLVFEGHVLFERDLHQMLYGQYASFARILRQGSWPVWDPWPGFGQPLIGNPAAQVLYPPTWLCLVFEPGRAYTFYVLLHLVMGALAVRALARRFGATPIAAAGAGICWMLSGPMLSLANLWHHLAGASLMPVVWLAADGVLRGPTLRRALLWGGAAGLQILAGSFDMCLLTAALTGPWWLYAYRALAARPPVRRLLTAAAVAGGVAFALGAGLLIPASVLWRGSARESLAEGVRAFWSLHPALLLQVALPLFPQALPLPPETRSSLFEAREPFLESIYLGLACLPLMAAALLPRPRRPAPFLAISMALSALIALGRHGLAYPTLVAAFPPLTSLRYPVKVTVVMALCGALLVGLGLDALREAGRELRRRVPSLFLGSAATLAALALAVALLRSLPPWLLAPEASADAGAAATATAVNRLLGSAGLGGAALILIAVGLTSHTRMAVLVFLAALDLGQAHRDLHATAPAALFANPPPVVSHLQLSSGTFTRIHAWDYLTRVLGKPYRRSEPEVPAQNAPREVPQALAIALARHDFLSPPTAARFGLYGSFDRDWLGLQPRGVRNLGLIFQAREETPDILRLLQSGGVSHVVSMHDEGLEALSPVATEASPFAGPVRLFRVEDPLPRAYAVGGVAVADGLRALQTLLSPDFDPRASVILPTGMEAPSPLSFTSDVRIVDARPDQVRIEAVLGAPGHVVLLDAWDPGWRAFVDGRNAALQRANVGFRAVNVPAGVHVVELVYRPRGLWMGLALSAGAAALVIGALLKRPPPAHAAKP